MGKKTSGVSKQRPALSATTSATPLLDLLSGIDRCTTQPRKSDDEQADQLRDSLILKWADVCHGVHNWLSGPEIRLPGESRASFKRRTQDPDRKRRSFQSAVDEGGQYLASTDVRHILLEVVKALNENGGSLRAMDKVQERLTSILQEHTAVAMATEPLLKGPGRPEKWPGLGRLALANKSKPFDAICRIYRRNNGSRIQMLREKNKIPDREDAPTVDDVKRVLKSEKRKQRNEQKRRTAGTK